MISARAVPLATKLPSAGVLVALVLAALVVIAVLVPLMRRHEDLLPLLAIFALPFRLPISAGGKTVNLLIPLYLVVAAGTITYLLPALLARRGAPNEPLPNQHAPDEVAAGEPALEPAAKRSGRWLERLGPGHVEALLLVAVLLYVLQAAYSSDRAKAAENIVFFYLPFALLFVLLRRVKWRRELLLRCLAVAVGLAVVFAGIGFIEYFRKSLFLNPKVVAANQYDNYFRVNSVFFDPNIYGRFLALVMFAVTTAVLWARTRREIAARRGRAGVAAVRAGDELLAVEHRGAAARAGDHRRVAVGRCSRPLRVGALLVLAGAVAVARAGGPALRLEGLGRLDEQRDQRAHEADKRRARTVRRAAPRGLRLRIVRSRVQAPQRRHSENATTAGHTIPVTIAAEQGIIGLALYLVLLVRRVLVLFRGAGRSPPRIAIAACFAALVLHTWTYADFLEDHSPGPCSRSGWRSPPRSERAGARAGAGRTASSV